MSCTPPDDSEEQTRFSCSICCKVSNNSKYQTTACHVRDDKFGHCLFFDSTFYHSWMLRLTGLSRNRHVLYCRQKQLKQHHSRRKSCTHCRYAKTRCNEATPQCARCQMKGLDCVYDDGHPKDLSLQLQEHKDGKPRRDTGIRSAGSSTDQVSVSLSDYPCQTSKIRRQNLSPDDNVFRSTQISPGKQLYNSLIEGDRKEDSVVNLQLSSSDTSSHGYSLNPSAFNGNYFPWVAKYQDEDQFSGADHFVELAAAYYPLESSQIDQLESHTSLQYPQELLSDSFHLANVDTQLSLLSTGTELMPIEAPAKGLFRQREIFIGSQLSCYYLLQTMHSYPKMMLSDTLPPFIHEKCRRPETIGSLFDSIETKAPVIEPLAICKNIMHMYFSKTKESTSFVWRTIEMELTRIEMKYHGFDDWTLMASLQALTMYILLATIEEDYFARSIDAKLLHVMSAVGLKAENSNYICSMAQNGEWQEWVLTESRNRTFTLLFIINMLFNINPTHLDTCNAISVLPVPAHKSLWQGTTHFEWEKAHAEFLKTRGNRPSLTYGDIITLHQKSQKNHNQTLGDLDDWFLNLDAFGTFVLMTAVSI